MQVIQFIRCNSPSESYQDRRGLERQFNKWEELQHLKDWYSPRKYSTEVAGPDISILANNGSVFKSLAGSQILNISIPTWHLNKYLFLYFINKKDTNSIWLYISKKIIQAQHSTLGKIFCIFVKLYALINYIFISARGLLCCKNPK